MVVEGRAVGVLALRRAGRPFAGEDLAGVELLAIGAALATDRLREAAGTQFAPDAVEAIHLVERGRLAAIQATANRGR